VSGSPHFRIAEVHHGEDADKIRIDSADGVRPRNVRVIPQTLKSSQVRKRLLPSCTRHPSFRFSSLFSHSFLPTHSYTPSNMSAPLTSAQKAALTRAANKLAQEQKDQELLKSVPVPRAAKISALNDHVWVSRKREAPEASVSDKKKKPKTTKAIADRHLPPDIDDDGDDIPHSRPPQKTAAVPEPPTKPAKLSSRASGAQTPGERSRTLHAPVALSKPAAQSVKDDGSESESGSQNEEGDDDVEEEEEDDEVVDPQQLVAEVIAPAPSHTYYPDPIMFRHRHASLMMTLSKGMSMSTISMMSNALRPVYGERGPRLFCGSLAQRKHLFWLRGSEQGSDDDLDYETRMQIARAAGGYGDKLVEQKVVDAEPWI
ncbi:hypothetical protein B0H10DRAFT_2328329, partial [Mycena sp. CBHHK59/15]